MDGELLAWDFEEEHPVDFSRLQKRLGRKKVGPKLQKDVPVAFVAYDMLEWKSKDIRSSSTQERRMLLENEWKSSEPVIRRSICLYPKSWDEAAAYRKQARNQHVEGLMLKRNDSEYSAGRKKGKWWKWKVDPYTIDAVLVYAQQGHGRRAGLYTDYTFSIWKDGDLVPFAKAYSGLSDAEIRQVDQWIRQNTQEKHGPVRVVKPELVFEIAFEGISPSKRHKSGIAVRFPRIQRWRRDKAANDADQLETVLGLIGATYA